jgi:hypothetical protein
MTGEDRIRADARVTWVDIEGDIGVVVALHDRVSSLRAVGGSRRSRGMSGFLWMRHPGGTGMHGEHRYR